MCTNTMERGKRTRNINFLQLMWKPEREEPSCNLQKCLPVNTSIISIIPHRSINGKVKIQSIKERERDCWRCIIWNTYGYPVLQRFPVAFLECLLNISEIDFASGHDNTNQSTVLRADAVHTGVQTLSEKSNFRFHAFHC